MNKLTLFGLCALPCLFYEQNANAANLYQNFQRVTLPFNSLHTSGNLFLSPQQVSEKNLVKTAQVCWIMDTGECLGSSFGWDDQTPGVTPPDNYEPKDGTDCIKEGYTLTSCPEGYKPNKYCLYDNKYFAECVPACPSDYKVCEDPYYGVGETCDGMYKECQCDECEGYEYTADNIPDGYIISGEACNSCDGPKYKVIPNSCDGFLDCGDMGCESGAETCQSGDKTLCSNCRPCPNLGTEDTCPPCTVCTYEECSNKYIVTGCKTGCTDYCVFNCSSMGYKQQSCSGTYVKCPNDTSYVYCLGN